MNPSNFRDTKFWATPRLAPESPTIADFRSVFGRFWPKAARLLCWNPLLKPLTMPSQHLGFMACAKSYSFTVLNFPRGLWWAPPWYVCWFINSIHIYSLNTDISLHISIHIHYPINPLSHFRRQPYSIVSFFLIGFSGLNSSMCCGFARGQRDLGTELCRKVARRNTSKLEMKTNQKHNNVTPNFINYIFGVC